MLLNCVSHLHTCFESHRCNSFYSHNFCQIVLDLSSFYHSLACNNLGNPYSDTFLALCAGFWMLNLLIVCFYGLFFFSFVIMICTFMAFRTYLLWAQLGPSKNARVGCHDCYCSLLPARMINFRFFVI